jgi:hypothetical protein
MPTSSSPWGESYSFSQDPIFISNITWRHLPGKHQKDLAGRILKGKMKDDILTMDGCGHLDSSKYQHPNNGKEANMVERVTPEEAYRKAKTGEILLVCGYDDDAQFKEMQLEGAISYKEFEAQLPSLPKDQEIVFYCG